MLSTKKIKATPSSPTQLVSSSSADMIASNDDILALILHRLPLKSLLKFKTVSKHWLYLITYPTFRPHHNSKAISGFLCADQILQSCNGLLLCCNFRPNRLDTTYYIYNPTTKHYTVLPPPRHSSSKPLGRPFVAPSNVQFENGVFWNGAIHWVSDWGGWLCFDVEEEQMRDILMPSGDGDLRLYRYFRESGDHLHLVEVYGSDNLQFDVYEMEKDHSGWFVKYQVDLNPVAAAFPEMVRGYADPIDLHSYAFSILCVVHEETDEDSFMVLHLPNKARRYNFKDNSFRKLHDFAPLRSRVGVGGDSSLEFEYFDAYQFIESFACV
ncbi:hypothetical protein V6Z11_A12G230200 [Gossypium hirsutum]